VWLNSAGMGDLVNERGEYEDLEAMRNRFMVELARRQQDYLDKRPRFGEWVAEEEEDEGG